MSDQGEIRRLAKLINGLQDQVSALANTPRLAYSSLEDAGFNEYNIDGTLVSRVGKQFDGTHTQVSLGGPPPPRPSAPTVEGGMDQALVSYDGGFHDPVRPDGRPTFAPSDWGRAEIHVGLTDTPGLSADTLRDTIESPRGGSRAVFGLPPGPDLWAWVVIRSQSGQPSEPSEVAGPFQVRPLTIEDLDLSQLAGTQVFFGTPEFYGSDGPATDKADLWLAEVGVDDNGGPVYETRRYDPNAGRWLAVPDQSATQALADAIAAQQAAAGAVSVAGGAAAAAADAVQAAVAAQARADEGVANAATAAQAAADAEATGSAATGAALAAQEAADAAAADARAALAQAQAAGGDATAAQAAATEARTAANNAQTAADTAGTDAARADAAAADAAADAAQAVADAAAAGEAAGEAQTTADRKTQHFSHPKPAPSSTGRTLGDTWEDTGDGNRRYVWTGAWTQRLLGNGAIEPESLVASDVLATGTVTASLLQSLIVLTTTIELREGGADQFVRIDPTGIQVVVPDQDGDGTPDVAMVIGGDGTRFATRQNGALTGIWGQDGRVQYVDATLENWPTIRQGDWSGQGGRLDQILDRYPRGMVAWGGRYENAPDVVDATGIGVFEIGARLYSGRMYKLQTSALRLAAGVPGSLAEVQVRYTWMGGPPTVSSPIAARAQRTVSHPSAESVTLAKLFGVVGSVAYSDYRFLLSYSRADGGGAIGMRGSTLDPIEMWIEDAGPYRGNLQQTNAGGGNAAVPQPPPPSAPPPQSKVGRWVCNWHQNWGPSGNFIDLPGASQGPDPYNGNMRSYLGFSGLDLNGSGLTMDQALAGSVIEDAGLYLYFWHWRRQAGGTAVIGMHGFRDPAPSFGGGNEAMIGDQYFNKGQGYWLPLGRPGVNLQNFASGVWKGIMLGQAGLQNLDFYGRADSEGTTNSPVLSIRYRK